MPRKSILALTTLCLAAVLALACTSEPEDPAERVSEIRSRYSARLNGLVVHQVPQPPVGSPAEPPVEVPGEAAEPVADDQAEGVEVLPPVPVAQAVTLDILVSKDGRDTLPSLTLDITQVDVQEEAKASWKAYLDVADVQRGPGTQISYRLEDVEYEEGDGFHVEVRHPVPAAERGEYREFQEYAEGS
jgi:hypothetical protein